MKARAMILAFALAACASAQDRAAIPVPASGNVTLPLDEYNKLLELAAKPVKKPEAPPVGFAMQRADLRFEAGIDSVSGTVELDGEVYGKTATRVALLSGFTIVDAQQKGKDLPLQMDNGAQTAVLGPGEFSLAISAMLPLSVEPGRTSFTLPVPSAGTVRLTLVIPGDRTNVNISSGLITGQTSSGGRTTVEATLMAGQPATVWWATRENVAPSAPREVRFLSDVKTLVSVSEVQLAIAALAEITVVQGEPSQFEVSVPAGYEITGVSGSSLESSDVQSGVLVLKVAPASQRSHQFLISMERPVKDPKAEVPFLSFKGTQRETGEVLVESEGTVELGARESGGLKRMDLREISTYLRQLAHAPLQAAFRYHRQPTEPVGLALEWVRFPAGQSAGRGGPARYRDHARYLRRPLADRGPAGVAQPGAAIPEGRAAARGEHPVGRCRGGEGQARARRRWRPRAPAPARLPPRRCLQRLFRLPARGHSIRPQRRLLADAAEGRYSDRVGAMGGLPPRAV